MMRQFFAVFLMILVLGACVAPYSDPASTPYPVPSGEKSAASAVPPATSAPVAMMFPLTQLEIGDTVLPLAQGQQILVILPSYTAAAELPAMRRALAAWRAHNQQVACVLLVARSLADFEPVLREQAERIGADTQLAPCAIIYFDDAEALNQWPLQPLSQHQPLVYQLENQRIIREAIAPYTPDMFEAFVQKQQP